VSGLSLPAIGFGGSPLRGGRIVDLTAAAAAARDLGYRLFDTAEAYGTERMFGAVLRGCNDAAVVSKVWQTNHAPAHVRAACEGSLRRLGREALELYLVHAPAAWAHRGPLEVVATSHEELERQLTPRDTTGAVATAPVPLAETWRAMLDLRRRGLVRAVGLANVGIDELEGLQRAGLELPAAAQVEIHPLRPAGALVEHCRRLGILVMAQSPLQGGAILADPRLADLARTSGRSPARLVLAWHRARGVVPIVGSQVAAHLGENMAAVADVLAAELVEAVDRLGQPPASTDDA